MTSASCGAVGCRAVFHRDNLDDLTRRLTVHLNRVHGHHLRSDDIADAVYIAQLPDRPKEVAAWMP